MKEEAAEDASAGMGDQSTATPAAKQVVNLAAALLAHRPRETSGAESANRFGYQRTWALCHLLKLHEQPDDYVLILEFHDDILVLDHASDPKTADFYQVKTKGSGQWSRKDLIRIPKTEKAKKPRKGKKPKTPAQQALPMPDPEPAPSRSILGKLLEHSRAFDASVVRSLNLISNATFKVELASSPESADRETFCLDAAKPAVLTEFESALNAELKLQPPLPWPKVHFHCTTISLKDHEVHATGVLANFLERRQPGGRFAVQPLYRTIAGEFTRRATCEWQPSSYEELCQKKGLRRSDVEEFLRHAAGRPDPEEQLKSIVDALNAEGYTYRDVTALQEGWRSYDIGITDMADVVLQQFRERVRAIAIEVDASSSWKKLAEYLRAGEALYSARHGALIPPQTATLLQGALLRELKNHEARKSSSPGSQPQEKAP